MGLRINQNIAAMNAYRNLSVNDGSMAKSLEKLSSGFRINRAADDAAGLSVSEGLRSQIGGLKVAVRNAQDGISVVQTAEGALTESTSILQRMRDLAVQAANGGSQDPNAQNAAQTEFSQLQEELDRIAKTTKFGSQSLLDGAYTGTFQVGANNTTDDQLSVDLTGGVFGPTVAAVVGSASTTTTATDVSAVSLTGKAITVGDGTNSASFTFTGQQGGVAANGLTVDDLSSLNTALTAAGVDATATASGGKLVITSDTNDGKTYTLGGAGAATFGAATATAGTAAVAASSPSATGFDSAGLGVGSAVKVNGTSAAQSAITALDDAIKSVSTARATMGAYQNRFEHTINNLNVAVENLSASESRIRDTDMAQEMVQFTRNQILTQAGTAMLAQANSAPQSVLQLLRG